MLVLPERAEVLLAYTAQFGLAPEVPLCAFPAFLAWKAIIKFIKPYAAQADGHTELGPSDLLEPCKEHFD